MSGRGSSARVPALSPCPTLRPVATEDNEGWVRAKDLGLAVRMGDDGTYWASLTRLSDGQVVAPDYGHGQTPEAAVERARRRYEVEQ